MKKIYNVLFIAFLSAFTVFQSCETVELEMLENPNSLSPDQANPTLLFNSVQLSYRNGVASFNNIGAQLGRIDYMSGRIYFNNYGSGTMNGPWANLFSSINPDIAVIEESNTDGSYDYILGASKAMQAHMMMLLVDYIGDIVWTEANMPLEFPNPQLDDDAAVYDAALSLLDEASALLQGSSVGTATDLYYEGDASKWIKFVNTLKMRAALTTGDYNGVINATNVIESADDNFAFAYGTNLQQPDTRHPDYASDYTDSGANLYRSNWLMNLMAGTYGDLSSNTDPRRRYYFYRQNAVTPGSFTLLFWEADESYYLYNGDVDAAALACSAQDVPGHLEFTEEEDYWCSMRLGYWGRIHGNNEGIPPDSFLRTASGVYPAGGRFDDNLDWVILSADQSDITFYDAAVGLGLGAGGAGIEPIILSSFVEFWRAEAYTMLGQDSNAEAAFEAGVTESISYVTTFSDPTADTSLAPTEEEIDDFIADITDDFADADDDTALDAFGWPVEKSKLDILGEQFFIAMYGGGADAFNFIRRTGYPRTLARNIDPNPGPFPRTLLYPSSEVNANPNVSQRQDNATQVFWDSGVTNPAN